LGFGSSFGGIVSFFYRLNRPELTSSSNPDQKAADLISFDAFADEEQGMSGHGGLALPNAGGSNPAAANNANMSSSGLPLDLFSSPSPSPTPNPMSTMFSSSSSSTPARQDPMAFFNTSAPIQHSIPQYQAQGAQRSQSPYGMPATQQGMGGGFGFGSGIAGQQQHQLGTAPLQPQQQQQQGYSLSPQPPQNGQQKPGQGQQGQKKDAFADLVDLMN
jgi:hypothetical protein